MALDNCPLCGGELVRRSETNAMGIFAYDLCQACGERFYFDDIIDAIDRARQTVNHTFTTRTDAEWYPIATPE